MKNHSLNPLNTLSAEDLQQLTKRIIHLRQDVLRMSQSQFAEKVEISQAYLSLLENQKKEFNIDTLMQIAISLKVNLDWLIYGIGGDDNIFQPNIHIHDPRDKENALSALKKAYSLTKNDIEFLQKYLALSDKERSAIIKAADSLRKLF